MNTPKTRNENIVVQEMENEILIYDLKTNKAFCLNATSAMIWQMCNGTRTVAEIGQSLSKKLDESVSEDLIWLALDNFKKNNLLENNKEFAVNFKGLNRRQVVKKIGLTSMIALPVIASIIAPSAAMAFSGFANCAACTTQSQCVSNNCLNMVCSVGTTNSFAPNTMLGAAFSVPSATCTALAAANCCSGNRIWFVTGNCFCG
jgi:hypothetical protein